MEALILICGTFGTLFCLAGIIILIASSPIYKDAMPFFRLTTFCFALVILLSLLKR